jgi:CheY-like chemotaxis protein
MRAMALDALLLSRDPEVLRILPRIMRELGADLKLVSTINDAADMLWRRKFDAFIIDCDDLPGAPQLLQMLRKGSSNRSTVVFAVVRQSTVRQAFEFGANFVVDKPLSQDRAQRSFRAAVGLMMRERRRYFRHELELSIKIAMSDGSLRLFTTSNLSEGGIAVRGNCRLPEQAQVRLVFTLPSGKVVDGIGQVAWSTDDGRAGIQLELPDAIRREFGGFLNQLKTEPSPCVGASSPGRYSTP